MKWTLARLGVCGAVLLAELLLLPLQARDEADIATQISDRAASALKRFNTESAEWRTEIELPGMRTVYRVNVLKEQDRMRYAGYAVPPDAEPVPLFRLFVVSNTWHVVEVDSRVKCRPWEHYFQFPVAELLLEASALRLPA
jgi:hypothetical protein